MLEAHPGVVIRGPKLQSADAILTLEAIAFVAALARRFGPEVETLLAARAERHAAFRAGVKPDFLPETAALREAAWTVAPLPADLQDRRVEITGPVDRKMIINALNSGANVFMADFEDSNAPTLANCLEGQQNLKDAIRRTITFEQPGKTYRLNDRTAVLLVRPRGWHLVERHFEVDGAPIPAGLFDFGLYFFHNAHELIARGTGPYFYLPKMESHREARLWNAVFVFAQDALNIPRGTIKATVLIETLPAAFEMDEILYELREHSAGLNCGRWDYIFSFIKTVQADHERVLPDRGQVTMTQPFMRAYTELLIKTCHRRHVHAMGGMAAQIPIKDDPTANEEAMAKVRADKEREVKSGHDGTWVAHPGLVPVAKAIFDAYMPGLNQLERTRDDVTTTAADLLRPALGTRTEEGLRHNIRVGVQYLAAWLGGQGCVPLYNLMEDAATAEISRTQVWQWVRHGATLTNGRVVTAAWVRDLLTEELAKLPTTPHLAKAAELFLDLATRPELVAFLTLPAYERLTRDTRRNIMSGSFDDTRWLGIERPYTAADVDRLKGSVKIEYTLADRGARKLWALINEKPYIAALGALSGNQAVQMAKAGLDAIYLSGWQVAADANRANQTYPDQSLYPADSVPAVVKRINNALQRADQIEHSEGGAKRDWFLPIVADAEAGFGGPLNAFELMKAMIEAGAAAVHFEDQLAAEKKCGHLGGKVLIPTSQFIRTLVAARLAADVLGVPTLLVARTDADSANLLTSDIDPRDQPFLTGERSEEGFFYVNAGIDACIARGLAYAPYADLVWMETSHPDLEQARAFADAIHAQFPGKPLAYNCSPSFNWKRHLDEATIARFQRELGEMGYKYQFVTLAGFHALNYSMFELARGYAQTGMTAYTELQEKEFAAEAQGYTATRHQREVGTGYFDLVREVLGATSTSAMAGSTEKQQF